MAHDPPAALHINLELAAIIAMKFALYDLDLMKGYIIVLSLNI